MANVSYKNTLKEFEHPTDEQKIIDPLAAVFEAMGKMQPWEFYGMQVIIQPAGDAEGWREEALAKSRLLLGEKLPKKVSLLNILMAPFDFVADFKFTNLLVTEVKPEQKNEQKNNLLNMTEVEKTAVNAVQGKAAKAGYYTKGRHMYVAQKDNFDPAKKDLIG